MQATDILATHCRIDVAEGRLNGRVLIVTYPGRLTIATITRGRICSAVGRAGLSVLCAAAAISIGGGLVMDCEPAGWRLVA